MTTMYLVRARENLEDGYLGRPTDIIRLTDNESEAKDAYIKYTLASLEETELNPNLALSFTDEASLQSALEEANTYSLEHDDIAVSDIDEIITSYGLPEDLSDSTKIKVAEILRVTPLYFEKLQDPCYTIYLPYTDHYLYYKGEFPDEYQMASITKDAELAFGNQPDFLINNLMPQKFKNDLIEVLIKSIPTEIKADSISDLTGNPEQLRSSVAEMNKIFKLTETENNVTIQTKLSVLDFYQSYEKISKVNTLLKMPFFIEKPLIPEQLIILYKESLDKVATYYDYE